MVTWCKRDREQLVPSCMTDRNIVSGQPRSRQRSSGEGYFLVCYKFSCSCSLMVRAHCGVPQSGGNLVRDWGRKRVMNATAALWGCLLSPLQCSLGIQEGKQLWLTH